MLEASTLKLAVIFLLATMLSGCADYFWTIAAFVVIFADDDVSSECGNIRTIDSSTSASYAASNIAIITERAIADLPDGYYSSYDNISTRAFGSIVISGFISSTVNESCGTDCVTSYNNHDIVVTFDHYADINNPLIISGEIIYSDTTGHQQDGQNLVSFGNISISDNSAVISYERLGTYASCYPAKSGVRDTIYSINSSGNTSSHLDQSGSLTATGGTFYF